MSLVTYIDDHYKTRVWYGQIKSPVTLLDTIHDYLSQPQIDDVLIIHGGQRDAEVPAKEGRSYLIEAIVRVCRRGGRAIVFSGGHPISAETLKRDLAGENLEENVHYLVLTAIMNLMEEIDLELLLESKVVPGWPVSEVKRPYAAPTLLTLALLTQASLLALGPEQVDHDAAELLGGRDVMAAIRAGAASAERMLTPAPWRVAFAELRGADDLLRKVEREWPEEGAPYPGVRGLVDALYDDTALPPDLLSVAFGELYRALEKKQELQN